MTTASSKRPKEVEEDEAEWREQLKNEKELLAETEKLEPKEAPKTGSAAWAVSSSRPDLVKLFVEKFNTWYEKEIRHKQRLNPIRMKRKAVNICCSLRLWYLTLPSDWVKNFFEKYSIELDLHAWAKEQGRKNKKTRLSAAARSRRRRGKTSASAARRTASASATTDTNGIKKPTRPRRKCTINKPKEDENRKFLRHVRQRLEGVETSCSSSYSYSSTSTEDEEEENPKKKNGVPKKFVDLTKNHKPPPFWLKAYAKGCVLPRVMSIYSTETENILYYDYTPKLKDKNGQEVKLRPRNRLVDIDCLDKRRYKTDQLRPPQRVTLEELARGEVSSDDDSD